MNRRLQLYLALLVLLIATLGVVLFLIYIRHSPQSTGAIQADPTSSKQLAVYKNQYLRLNYPTTLSLNEHGNEGGYVLQLAAGNSGTPTDYLYFAIPVAE